MNPITATPSVQAPIAMPPLAQDGRELSRRSDEAARANQPGIPVCSPSGSPLMISHEMTATKPASGMMIHNHWRPVECPTGRIRTVPAATISSLGSTLTSSDVT